MDNTINICYITDKNYTLPTATSLLSLIETCSSKLNISIVTDNVPETIIEYYKSLASEKVNVSTINKEIDYQNVIKSHLYVSKSALIKFELPNILSNLDKVLYIDSDTLIFKDLNELYNTDISEVYAGVISDFIALKRGRSRLGLDNYFNSGVMLLNLKKLREDNVSYKLVDYKINSDVGPFMDQDCLNAVFNKNVKYISPEYNFIQPNLKYADINEYAENYKITIDFANELFNGKYAILHITNTSKPWKSLDSGLFNIWFKYFQYVQCDELSRYFYNNITLKVIDLKSKIDEQEEEIKLLKLKVNKSIFKKIFSAENTHIKNEKVKIFTILGKEYKIYKNKKEGNL